MFESTGILKFMDIRNLDPIHDRSVPVSVSTVANDSVKTYYRVSTV